MVPGVIAMVVMLLSPDAHGPVRGAGTEIGTMDQILVTPIRPFELMFGKTIPFVLISWWTWSW